MATCSRTVHAELTAKLAHLAEVTDRLPQPFPVLPEENFAA